ncbi:MAG: hypothetical protein CMA47_00435 [Euryarchaeota archaeon]|nr:hypothetical protein [Euryarchaeota archaeon]
MDCFQVEVMMLDLGLMIQIFLNMQLKIKSCRVKILEGGRQSVAFSEQLYLLLLIQIRTQIQTIMQSLYCQHLNTLVILVRCAV